MFKLVAILFLIVGVGIVIWQLGWVQPETILDLTIGDVDKFEGVWCGENQCFWFDEKGISNRVAPRPEGNLIIVVDDPAGNFKTNSLPLSELFWSNISLIIQSWPMTDWMITNLVIDRDKKEVVASSNQFDIYFSLEFDPTTNLKALKKSIDENKINLSELSYIDLRVENKIYLK